VAANLGKETPSSAQQGAAEMRIDTASNEDRRSTLRCYPVTINCRTFSAPIPTVVQILSDDLETRE
jgi:hypothetical protein